MRDGRAEPAQAEHHVSAVPQEALQHHGTRQSPRANCAQQLSVTGDDVSAPGVDA